MTGLNAPFVLSEAERERVEQIDQLIAMGSESAHELVAQLDDPSWTVRRAVVAALAAMGDAGLVPLVQQLRTNRSDETVLAAMVDALAASTGNVPAALEPLVADRDPAVVADVAQILGRRQGSEAIPTLVTLTEHANDNVAVAAIEALGRIGGRAAIEPLIRAIGSGNFFRVFPAIDVLGRSGDPRATPALAALLGHRLYALEVARALGRGGDRSAVAPLAGLLTGTTTAEVRVGAQALADLVERFQRTYGTTTPVEDALRRAVNARQAARAITGALAGADVAEKTAIARVAGMLHDEAAAALLTTLIREPDEAVAAAAAEGLRNAGSRFEDVLVRQIREENSTRRKLLLPLMTQADSASAIASCLSDEDPEVRIAACDALARIGNPTVVATLFQRLSDSNAAVVQAAVGAIQSLGSAETEVLAIAAARSPSASVRRWALRVLAYFGSRGAVDVCLAGLQDEDLRVRDSAIAALPFLEDPRGKDALLEAARDPVPRTRAAAMRALGACRSDVRALAALMRGLSDPDPWVRYYTCQSLGRLEAEPATESIARLLTDEAGQVRVAAVEALAYLKSQSAHDHLVAAARSEDADVQRAALIGLGLRRSTQAIPILMDATSSADAATRMVALGAIAVYESQAVTTVLATAAEDTDEAIRNAAIGFLAGRRGSTPILIDLLRRHRSTPRLYDALAHGSADRVSELMAALEKADDFTAPLLTSALARMQRPDASAALLKALTLPHLPARKAAAVTLAGIGTRDALIALRAAAASDPDPEVRRICALVLA